MFEILTSIYFPNHMPGTMPSLSLFFIFGFSLLFWTFWYITHGGRLCITGVTSISFDLESFSRGHGDK